MPWGYAAVALATVAGAKMSSDAASDASDAQVEAAKNSAEVQKAIYRENKDILMPFISAATGAGQMNMPKKPVLSDFTDDPSYITKKEGTGRFAHSVQIINPNRKTAQQKYQAALERYNRDIAAYRMQPKSSLQLQQELLGLYGPDAQKAAYESYQESPGVAWLRSQGMRGIENNVAATGRGGGSRLKAISEFNQGLALQDFGNYYNRVAGITDIGLRAGGALSGASLESSRQIANSYTQAGQAQAGGALGRAAAWQSGINNLTTLAGIYYGTKD